jgi:hypothetical protein
METDSAPTTFQLIIELAPGAIEDGLELKLFIAGDVTIHPLPTEASIRIIINEIKSFFIVPPPLDLYSDSISTIMLSLFNQYNPVFDLCQCLSI